MTLILELQREKKDQETQSINSSSSGPRTRGQAKEPTTGSPDVEINETHVLTTKEKLQALKYGSGSMVAYNELRKREKLDIQKETPMRESRTQEVMSESGRLGDTHVDKLQ
ncbi:uncharacterized protein LOC141719588 [Apium graveolens]|uniref:uncharacterized protein LOC141719588 n=1 Tax=Apium graveolens TaxID=4045 RepID=UPI003D7BDCB1